PSEVRTAKGPKPPPEPRCRIRSRCQTATARPKGLKLAVKRPNGLVRRQGKCDPMSRIPDRPMSRSFSVRVRLAGMIFLLVAPASVLMYLADKYYPHTFLGDVPWPGLVIGMLALGAAWYGGERYII